ncbi:MAG: methylmalonyl-CoA mutase [Rhodospirillales bacterium]|nr:methylmalonyl-CoA mutase [Rhodospirillales bacterium]
MTEQKSDSARSLWEREYKSQVGPDERRFNRSGIEIRPLYTAADREGKTGDGDGYPGQSPHTRGIYASMHRGRSWSQRQLVGLATPKEYNARMHEIAGAGATALSMIPCNSVYRGYDIDEVDPLLLGTCGTTINTIDDMDQCLKGFPIDRTSISLNDPLPFTLQGMLLGVAKRRGVPWASLSGTSNQSDYISHFVANHMFFRLALEGSRRVLVDHVVFAGRHLPKWNPISIVGQHMQQSGATPAEAMGFALCTALQYGADLQARGLKADDFLPRFTFFFDISISFFEEIAKFRAGRRLWSRLTAARFGAENPRSRRFKFHAQTSGVDLTRQQPLNNIARTATQAIAGILGGLQSMHTDAYDEVLSTPTEGAARIAVATQNILREEAHLADVIDPLGGSYYVEQLTDEMEARILEVIAVVDAAGGMFRAVESGLVQQMIGKSALEYQDKIDKGEEKIIGVNAFTDSHDDPVPPLSRPDMKLIEEQLGILQRFKAERSAADVQRALDGLSMAAADPALNIMEKIAEAASAGVTQGEMCTRLRAELGFGHPLIMV